MAKARKKKVIRKAPKKKSGNGKEPYGVKMKIAKVGDNPRREGTGGHEKYAAMAGYMKKNPTATVADVIANTTYKAKDLVWDRERGHIKVSG